MKYSIYNQSGTVKAAFEADSSCTHDHKVQTDNVLNLTFTLIDNIGLEVNDYILIGAERFTLMEPYQPEQKSTLEYAYNVKFYGAENIASKAIFVDTEYRPITQYYDTPAGQLAYIVACINRVVGSNVYSVGAVVSSDAIQVSYQEGCTCLEALTTLSAAVGTEWWLDVTSFNLTKCEYGTPVELGYNQGLLNLTKEVNSSDDFYTRLIPQGSTKNIVPATYGHQTLQLPGGAKYVDFNADLYGIKEHYEAAAFADIFPRFTGTVGTVRTVQQTIEGVARTIYFFTSPGIPFNPNDYTISGTQKHLVFKSGDLLSQDFEANWYPETGEWELILQYPDENTQLPGGNLIPRAGDTYTVYNLNMPTEYYPLAEAELKAAVDALLADHAVDYSVYKAPTDHVYLEQNNITLTIGRRVKLLSDLYFPIGYRDSRITRVVRKLSDLNDMDIEISNQLIKSGYSQLKEDVSSLQTTLSERLSTEIINIIKSYQSADLTDDNMLSSLRVLREIAKHAISREVADTVQGLITFLRGLKSLGSAEFGEVIDSMLAGRGTLITPNKIQTPRLEVRGQAVFMELIINRLSAMEGDTSFSDSGTIESVTQVAELTYKLQMRRRWETDFTSFDVGDVVYGIVNDLFNGSYYKVWFLVQARDLGSNELIVVQYTDSMVPGGVNYPPTDGMVVARRGNTTNEDRQSCWYISTTEGAIMYLTGVTNPILEESNYSLILGRPKQLELFNGLPLNYNNPYLYARGAIIQDLFRIDYQGNPSYEDIDCGLWDSNRQYINGYNDVSKRYVREGVWHESSYWRCTAAQSTIGVPPRFNNTEWTCLVGDKNYTIEILNPDKLVRVTAVAATLSVVVRHGTMDITSDVVLWEWTRSSGLPAEDNLWAIERKASESVLAITNADMASNWLDKRKVSFRVQATIIPGVAPLTAEYSIN